MQAAQIDEMVGVLQPLVQGKAQSVRLAIYEVSYAQCLNSMLGGG